MTSLKHRNTFGRKTDQANPHSIDRPDIEATVQQIDENAAIVNLIGQATAALGLVMVMIAVCVAPLDPFQSFGYNQTVFVPPLIKNEFAALGLDVALRKVIEGGVNSPIFEGMLIFVALIGAVGVYRRRWIIVGVVAVLLLMPWEWLGFMFEIRPVLVALIIVALIARCLPLSGWKRWAFIAVMVMFGPIIVAIIASIIMPSLKVYNQERATYPAIKIADINQLLATDASAVLKFTVPVDDPHYHQKVGANAFVWAQIGLQRGDVKAVKESLALLDEVGFKLSRFEAWRLSAARKFLAQADVSNGAQQMATVNSDRIFLILSWIIHVLGIIFALAGPFSDVVRNQMHKRLGRIRKADSKLKKVYAKQQDQAAETAEPLLSDTVDIVALLERRIIRFGLTAGAFFGLAMIAYASSIYFYLPPAHENTAFASVGLLFEVAQYAVSHGFFDRKEFGDGFGGTLFPFLGFASIIIIALTFIVKNRLIVYPLLLGWLVVGTQGLGMVASDPLYQISAADFPSKAQLDFERSLIVPREKLPENDDKVVLSRFQSINTGLKRKGENWSPPKIEAIRVKRDFVLFTLAQIAYLENRPEKASELLNRLPEKVEKIPPYFHVRTQIMRDWVEAQGYSPTGRYAGKKGLLSPGTLRSLSNFSVYLSAIAGFIALLISAIVGLLLHRRANIQKVANGPALTATENRIASVINQGG